MNLTKALTSDEIVQLSGLRETGPGKALVKALESARASDRVKNEERPMISEDITKDFRYIAGRIAMASEALSFSDAAMTIRQAAGNKEKSA